MPFFKCPAVLLLLSLPVPLHSVPLFAQPAPAAQSLPAAPADAAALYAREALIVQQHAVVLRFTADGLGERTDTMRIKVQSDASVRALGVLNFAYASNSEHVEIVYLRVRKPDGSVVATPDSDAQDMPSAVTRTAPMYSDTREKQVPVKSLSVGDTLEYQVKVVRTAAEAPNQFWYMQNFLLGNVVLAESVELRVPKGKYVQVVSAALQPLKKVDGGETVYRWQTSQLLPAPSTEDEKKILQKRMKEQTRQSSIMVTTYHSWAEVGEWYRGLAKERDAVTPPVRAKADEVTRGLKTDDERIRAIYAYVSSQIRYISISFGQGRYQPHAAAMVLDNQYGDCKDKDSLLRSMLQAEGIAASPVLIGSQLKLIANVPAPGQFDHVITLVESGNEKIWLDTTPEVAPFRMLLQPLRDKEALWIPATTPARLVTTPADPPFPSFYDMTTTGALDSAGTLKGHIDVTTRGDAEVGFRMGLHQTARAQWQELFQNVSYEQGFAGTVSNVDGSLPEKTADPYHYSYDYERKEFSDWPEKKIMTLLPPEDLAAPGDEKPQEPLELGAPAAENYRSTITLPEGYTAQLPEAVTVKNKLFEYTSSSTMKGQQLITERKLLLKASKVEPADWGDYKKWQKQVADDYGQFVQLYSPDQQQQALDAGSPEAQRLVREAFDQFRQHDLDKAEGTLKAAEKVNPEQMGLWATRGYLEQQRKEVDAAIEDFEKEIKLHPHNRGVYDALIWAEANLGRKELVLPTLEKMVAAYPGDGDAQGKLASALMSRREYAKAVQAYTLAIKEKPENKQFSFGLGNAQLRAGMRVEGEATLQTLLKGSEDPLLLNDAAYELAEAGLDLPLSEASCRHSLTLQDTQTQDLKVEKAGRLEFSKMTLLESTWDTMGWILYREGKLPEAESYLNASWSLSQKNVVGSHLGQLYEAMGRKREALTVDQLAIESRAPGRSGSETAAIQERALKLSDGKKTKEEAKNTESLLKMRTIDLPEFKKGEESTADFNLVWSANGLEDVDLVKGDEALRPAVALLKKANPAQPFPEGSKAKLIRRGILACSDVTKKCEMVLLYPLDAAIQGEAVAKQ